MVVCERGKEGEWNRGEEVKEREGMSGWVNKGKISVKRSRGEGREW